MGRHIPHLFVADPWNEDRIDLGHEARRHLERVLRIKAPAVMTYTNGAGLSGSGTFGGPSITRGSEELRERPSQLTVAVAPPKSSARLRFVVEKLAEIGVARLVWIDAEHTAGRPPRTEKASAWAIAALEQSRGAWLMEVEGPVSVSDVTRFGTPVFADQGGGSIRDIESISDPVLCVGPEGGFASDELPEKAFRLSLGSNVLRVETAAVVGAVMVIGRSPG